MTLFRIHTECSTPAHEKVIHDGMWAFDAYNVIIGQGCWKGQREGSATIEVYADISRAHHIHTAAQYIKTFNNQEAILIARVMATSFDMF